MIIFSPLKRHKVGLSVEYNFLYLKMILQKKIPKKIHQYNCRSSFKHLFDQSSKHQHALPEIFNGGENQIFAWIGVNKIFFANIIVDIRYESKVFKGNRYKKSFSKTLKSSTLGKGQLLHLLHKLFPKFDYIKCDVILKTCII